MATTEDLLRFLQNCDIMKLKQCIDNNETSLSAPIITEDEYDLTLLHLAAGLSTESRNLVIKFLLSYGQDIDVNQRSGRGNDGWTAAHIATCWGHHTTLRILLEHGADPFMSDFKGLNAWDIAQVYDEFVCIFVLELGKERKADNYDDCRATNGTILISDNSDATDDDSFYSVVEVPVDHHEGNSTVNISSDSTIAYYNRSASLSPQNSVIMTKKHVDRQFGVTLLELSICAKPVKPKDEDPVAAGPVSLDVTIANLNKDELRDRLMAMGDSPGPIVQSTEPFYRRRLQKMRSGTLYVPPSPGKSLPLPGYSVEVNNLIQGELDFKKCKVLEKEFIAFFDDAGPAPKNYFNYLLLDPRVTENMPASGRTSDFAQFNGQLFKRFIEAIFYVGKGQGNRPFMHLYEAALVDQNMDKRKKGFAPNKKINQVLEIWKKDLGVVSLHCFHTISSNEALARECMMIDAMGLSNLTNIQIGQNRAKALRWNDKKKQMLGTYLLYKAYTFTYLVNGERQIKRGDVRK